MRLTIGQMNCPLIVVILASVTILVRGTIQTYRSAPWPEAFIVADRETVLTHTHIEAGQTAFQRHNFIDLARCWVMAVILSLILRLNIWRCGGMSWLYSSLSVSLVGRPPIWRQDKKRNCWRKFKVMLARSNREATGFDYNKMAGSTLGYCQHIPGTFFQ